MELLNTSRRQSAVYWPKRDDGAFDEHGEPVFENPVQLRVRWESKVVVAEKPGGETFVSRARVMTHDFVTEVGGVLWQGKLQDIPLADRPYPFRREGAYQIQMTDEIPTLEADDFFRSAWL